MAKAAVSSSQVSSTSGLAARRVAVECLAAIMQERQSFSDAIAGDARFEALSDQDKAFMQRLVYTVLRHVPWLDAAMAAHMKKPFPQRMAIAQQVLRIGAAQIILLDDIPVHAAVHTSVSLADKLRLKPVRGLINAVLRRITEDKEAGRLPERSNWLPEWLQQSWSVAYGDEVMQAIAAATQQEPPLDITVKQDAAKWAEACGGQVLGGNNVRLPAGQTVTQLPGFKEGAWWVQDVAASLPAQLLGDVRGKRVLDCCAAPGGKTMQLAAAGAEVTAVDKSAGRLKRLQQNLERVQLQAEVVPADLLLYNVGDDFFVEDGVSSLSLRERAGGEGATCRDVRINPALTLPLSRKEREAQATPTQKRPSLALYKSAQPFPFILLDAPCTATGTLRRHPDVVYTKSSQDVKELAALQARLLDKATEWLEPGGRLVYCVCSLQPQEGEKQVEAFLKRQEGRVVLAPIDAGALPYADARQWVTPEGVLRCLPSALPEEGGMDGFFAACFVRVG